jgi:hypothetical protein
MAMTPHERTTTMNITTASLFDQLNKFRVANGKAPLKAWKESRAKLEASINSEVQFAHNAKQIDIAKEFEAHQAELQKQQTRQEVIADRPSDAITDTSAVGTSNPEKTAALKAARIENEAKDAALAKLEADKPSPSARQGEFLDAMSSALKGDLSSLKNLAEEGQKTKQTARKINAIEKKAKTKAGDKKSTTPKAGFSAAQIIKDFGIDPKQGRAMLRKHNVAKTTEAIRAFFNARKK